MHWRSRGRRGRRAWACKIGLKSVSGFLSAAALSALKWIGELRFLWRLSGPPFLLTLGAVYLALYGVLLLGPCKLPQGSSSFCFSWPPDICLCEPLLVFVLVMPRLPLSVFRS